MTEIRVECGCVLEVEHELGERLVTCGGGDRTLTARCFDGVDHFLPVSCPGGRPYVVTAERGPVVYTATEPSPAVRARLEAQQHASGA